MKPQLSSITDFLSRNSAVFTVPVFQRRYSWSVEQCKKLLEDIHLVIEQIRNGEDSPGHLLAP